MNKWVTDRLPSLEDANPHQFVIIPNANISQNWQAIRYQEVKMGQVWAPWPTMPPYELEPEYWECPEDIPKDALWFLDSDGDCDMIQTVTSWGIFLAQNIKIQFDELEGWRWSDKPFSRFKDGKLCVKGGSNE